jgi:hypothetical protein
MAETLTFEITYLYADSAEGIAIPVALFSAKGMYNTWAKVDPGAEVCLFTNEVGLRLGLDVERGIPKLLGSIGGSTIESFGHEVTIQTFGIVMSSTVYFAKYPGITRNLLGRLGWLRNLQIGLRDYDNKLYISEYTEME